MRKGNNENNKNKINYLRKFGEQEKPKLQTQAGATTTRSPGRGGRGRDGIKDHGDHRPPPPVLAV
jgi:hypothetical protein